MFPRGCRIIFLALIAARALMMPARSYEGESPGEIEGGTAETSGEATGISRFFRFGGYLESENFIMPGKGLKKQQYRYLSGTIIRIRRNEELINKIEAHGSIDLRAGTDTIHGRAIIHGYVYPQKNGTGHLNSRVVPRELYIRWLTTYLNLTVGRQVIRWGTADMLNPTAHFAPPDLSEIVFKDDDEFYQGVHALSATVIAGDFSLQLVTVPIATPTVLPDARGPWSLQFPDTHSVIPVQYLPRKPSLPTRGGNISWGGRFAGTAGPVDFSFSAYRGVDRDVLLQPHVDPRLPIPTVYVIPRYRRLTAFGFDIAAAAGDFTLQAEAAYSFDKHAVEKPSGTGLLRAVIRPTHFVNAAAGVNWLIDGEDFNITLEFNKSIYIEGQSSFIEPYLSDIFVCRVEKKFLRGALITRLQGLVTIHGDYLLMPAIGYDFLNGLVIETEGGIFGGPRDTLFGSYRSRDILRLRIKYQF